MITKNVEKKKMSKGKKAGIAVLCIVLVVAVLVSSFLIIEYVDIDSDKYTDEQHLQRVTKLAEKRYLSPDSPYGYTDMKIYPVYDENEKLRYFLIDFEPNGYVYILINKKSGNVLSQYLGSRSMYTRDSHDNWVNSHPRKPRTWQRYRYWNSDEPYPESGWKYPGRYHDTVSEVNENGDYIAYIDSHFKVARIGDERRYMLMNDYTGDYIPAVKRGNKFLNLVSMQSFDLLENNQWENVPYSDIGFNVYYDL